MKPTGEKTGFTIIELLTVMSIIVILMSIMVPALNRVRRFAKKVEQRAQFYAIEKALEEYRDDHDGKYPDSSRYDTDDPCKPYCGAMKLAEAMIGQDGMGLHQDSVFHADGQDAVGHPLYPFDLSVQTVLAAAGTPLGQAQRYNIGQRTKYLENDDVGRAKLAEMFSRTIAPFETNPTLYPNAVLCDVFLRTRISSGPRLGDKVGMPVLYYRADVRKLAHDVNVPDNPDNIYNYRDNTDLIALGLPWENPKMQTHPIEDPTPAEFYKLIQNKDIITVPTPYKKDSYILISAGYDGKYGTRDDVFNFKK